ncbi:hypothetical protein AGMMS49940_24630 [Spirochaetia bacterium]|nr:hypothetical protein AGMMS49940_24630 [Spirochaetia bacterium]
MLGSRGRIANTRVTCSIENLHQGDYKTLFVRYRIPPRTKGLQAASLRITSRGSPSAPFEQTVILTDPINAYAAAMLRHSGAVVDFAEALREIGAHYYNAERDVKRLELALRLSQETKLSLESAKRNIQTGALTQELSVITKYVEILIGRVAENRRPFVPPSRSAPDSRLPNESRPVSVPHLVSETRPVREPRPANGAPPADGVHPIRETRPVNSAPDGAPPASGVHPIRETRPANSALLVPEPRPADEALSMDETLSDDERPFGEWNPFDE